MKKRKTYSLRIRPAQWNLKFSQSLRFRK